MKVPSTLKTDELSRAPCPGAVGLQSDRTVRSRPGAGRDAGRPGHAARDPGALERDARRALPAGGRHPPVRTARRLTTNNSRTARTDTGWWGSPSASWKPARTWPGSTGRPRGRLSCERGRSRAGAGPRANQRGGVGRTRPRGGHGSPGAGFAGLSLPRGAARYVSGPGGFFGSATYWPIHFIEEWLNGPQLVTASALAADPEIWGSIGGDLISLALAGETSRRPLRTSARLAGLRHGPPGRRAAERLLPPGGPVGAARLGRGRLPANDRGAAPHPDPAAPPAALRAEAARSRPYLLTPTFKIGRELWLRRRLTAAEAAHSAGITEEEAVQSLERDLTPGLLEAEAAGADGRSDLLPPQSGRHPGLWLTARRPGPGLTPYVERRIALTTPFPVEYVRQQPNPTRARRYWCRCRQATARRRRPRCWC